MADFPRRIHLKTQKCPSCGDTMGAPSLDASAATLRVVCQKKACGYAIDLAWLGELPSAN
ncbi:MAG: hypothetical protein HYZ75_06300 [Elusimicrobia bacterium]|nr:hypothetical protein [Elusimicrobiota bacterium]